MKCKIPLFLIVSFVAVLSCSKDKEDTSHEKHETVFVISVDAPASGRVDEVVTVEVDFQVRNGCGEFGRFIEVGTDTKRTIKVEAEYKGLTCTQDLPIRTVTYEFIPDTTGEYILEFLSAPEEYLSVVINVE